MTDTFTRHERPQSLAQIMREAWIIKRATQCPFGDALKAAWALARSRAGERLPDMPVTLMQQLHGLGGLKPCSELKQIAAPLVILRRNGLELEDAARLLTDHGFDIRDDRDRLIDCIRDELVGSRHYPMQDAGAALNAADWATANEIPF